MADVFKEVDEADRQARLEMFWEKYRWLVYGAIASLIAMVAGWEAFAWNKERVANERMLVFEEALALQDQGQYEKATEIYNELISENSPLSPLAVHYLANLQADELGEAGKALETLKSIDSDGSVFSDIAQIKYAYATANGLTFAELETEFGPLLEKQTALAAMANELVAVKAFSEGNYTKASAYYNRLENFANIPTGMSSRIGKAQTVLKHLIPAETAAYENADENAETTAASGLALRGPSQQGLDDQVVSDANLAGSQSGTELLGGDNANSANPTPNGDQ